MMLGFADNDAQDVNVLIYPIADECHEFRGDLTAFNNKIRTELLGDKTQGYAASWTTCSGAFAPTTRFWRPPTTASSSCCPRTRSSSAGRSGRAGRTLQEDVRFRYAKGFHPDGAGDAIEVPGVLSLLRCGWAQLVPPGRLEERPRYEHGGLSLAEMVIPGRCSSG